MEINIPKNTYFLAPHPEKIRIFSKRYDGTITKHITNHWESREKGGV
jgi:hypothetical protein